MFSPSITKGLICLGIGTTLLVGIQLRADQGGESFTDVQHWVAATFLGKTEPTPAKGYLMVYNASGEVAKNGLAGHSFRIANKEYARGLGFPLVGTVLVHLPAPGKSFEAMVGVDSSGVGYSSEIGYGNVAASLQLAGKEVFRTATIREGMTGIPVKVDLGGATEFTLGLEAVGPRRAWDDPALDNADWAEARVTLADGRALWLADLPVGPLPMPYKVAAPFSFRYGNQPSSVLLERWELQRSERRLDPSRTEYVLTYRDPKTGLVVRCVAVAYRDFPTVEWTVYFKNTGKEDTPILEQIQALDTRFERSAEGEFILHHNKGSNASATDFQPLETRLDRRADERIAAGSGRPTANHLSYFNLEWPGQGVIIAVGWPGDWAAQFTRGDGAGLRVQAGQELTHFKLLPGEEVRSPLVALQFWHGDWIGAQNVWRNWMIAYNVPRPGGKLPAPQLAAETGYATNVGMQDGDESNMKALLDRHLEERIPLDYWWMDAGWYPFRRGWWDVGTWEPDPTRFPRGLRAVTDYARSKGVKSIVWFEPERVTPGTWLYEKHPEWLLGPRENKLLFLGNPEALHWLIEHIATLIKEQGIDLYRQDFNFDPLPIWRANDQEDRQGITEIRHVTGYLAYWDELRRRFPNMLIDTCSGGGGRDDLETLRRAVPLWRSDRAWEPTAMQNLTYGLALWLPYFGTGIRSETNRVDAYSFRSDMCPAPVLQDDVRRQDLGFDLLRRLCSQWRQIAEYYYGDYYPLSTYSTENDAWAAWQFNRPDHGDGMVQVFRRPDSSFEVARFKLHGLNPSSQYKVANLDVPGTKQMTGQQLMEQGLGVEIKDQPGSAIFTYERLGH